jgi:peptidoglycan-associated lipoprotein
MKNRYTEIMAGEETLRQSLASAPDRRPLARRVFFKPDCHEVQDEFLPLIQAHAEYLRENPDRFAVVSGHTWGKGTESYCRLIGERRSRAVAHALVRAGACLSQIAGLSKGSATPVLDRGSKAPQYLRRANIEYCSAEELAGKLLPKPGAPTWWKAALGQEPAKPELQTA